MNLRLLAAACAAILLTSAVPAGADTVAAETAIRGLFAANAPQTAFNPKGLSVMKPFLSSSTNAMLADYVAHLSPPNGSCFFDVDPFSHSQMNSVDPKAPLEIVPAGRLLDETAFLVTARTIGKGTHPATSLVFVSPNSLVDDVVNMGPDGKPAFEDSIVAMLKGFQRTANCRKKNGLR